MKKGLLLVAALFAAVSVLVGAGGTLAGDGHGDGRKAFRDAVAKKLGVTPEQLQAAFAAVVAERLDAAVASGNLSAVRAAKLKQAIADGKLGKLRLGLHKRAQAFAKHGAPFGVVTRYLGVTGDELKAELEAGKSLADVAKAHGKSADGLVNVVLAKVSGHLDRAVAKGYMTKAHKQELLAKVRRHLDQLVAKRFAAKST